MSTPPKKQIWIIQSTGTDPGGKGKDLDGCQIVFTGNTFELMGPDAKKLLASMPSSLVPIVPFTFPVFSHKDTEWAVVLWTLPMELGTAGSGTWATSGKKLTATRRHGGDKGTPETDPQSGDFTAMNGGAGDPEEATYRAKA